MRSSSGKLHSLGRGAACPVCNAAARIHDTRDLPYSYKGETSTIPAVTTDFCEACGESITDSAETTRVMSEMQSFNRQANAAIVEPGDIAKVRRKLNLGLSEAVEIFGGDINAFARCETGEAIPPLALIKLIRLLNRHPNHSQ